MGREAGERGSDGGVFAGEKGGEMVEEEEGTESVDAEGGEGVVVGDLGGGFLRVEDAGDGEGEVEVGG